MAEVHIIGEILSAQDFKQSSLSCKWSFHTGSGWNLINGSLEGQTQECCDIYVKLPVWDHPFDLHYTTQTLQGSPKLLVQVFSRDNYGRLLFIGYSVVTVPLAPGSHRLKCHTWKPVAIDIDDIFVSNCTNQLNCDDPINTDLGTSYSTRKINAFNEHVDTHNIGQVIGIDAVNSDATTATRQTPDTESPTTRISTGASTLATPIEPPIDLNNQVHSRICPCDVTVSTCDNDCCCDDTDCNGFQLSGYRNYSYHQSKMYDSRYCYTKNYILPSTTEFILERLARNLFCIAYDNLPPIYGIQESLNLRDQKSFQDATTATNRNKYSWEWNNLDITSEINMSSRYYHPDRIWKFQNNKITLLELPQSGFNGECKFRRTPKYRESSKWKCMQTNLSNNNEYLFGRAYDNFTVVSPSHFVNLTFLMTQNHTCSDSVCVPVQSFYCLDSRNICNTTKSPAQSCVEGVCQNVIKRVHYKIAFNGTCGLRSIQVRYEITNTSKSFYQYFQVTFEKGYWPSEKSFISRGNPGYAVGNPIITATSVQNNTNNVLTEYTNVTNSIGYLTLPMSQSNGECHSHERYIVEFGADIKTKCTVKFTTDQFSSDSCIKLQNQLMDIFLNYLSQNAIEIDKMKIYVSKTGEIAEKASSNWTQILLDNVAGNVITGLSYDNRIRCSGLLTSVNINILYTIQPKLNDFDTYKVEGISVTFNEPFDITWMKCVDGPKCNNDLKIELSSFVSFTDISTKSMYYYASGPNLDISLPYDFFYPFMNHSSNVQPPRPPYLMIHLVIVFFFISRLFKPS